MTTPPPFFSNEQDDSSSGEAMNQPGGMVGSLPPPSHDNTTDSEDEIQALQASYNDKYDEYNIGDDNTTDNKFPASVFDSVTNGTPEPNLFTAPPPPPPPQQHHHQHHHSNNIPPPPYHSYNKPPPAAPPQQLPQQLARIRSGNKNNNINNNNNNNNNNNEKEKELIDIVSFTSVLRQVDVGIEMTDRLKEVIRKFCKHQQMGADKLQEIYNKIPSTYQETDGMKDFSDLCALVHTLILETVSAQKRLADFLFKDVVPKMDNYIKEKQQQIQELKKNNHSAEMKLKNSINTMNKASNTAKNTAMKAKQLGQIKNNMSNKNRKQKTYEENNKSSKKKKSNFLKKFKHNPNSDLSEEEQAYLKAQTNQLNYEATVMAANYEQETYKTIQSRFKKDCKNIEQQRISYCHNKIQQFINAHRSYFNNETIMVLQTRILSGLDSLNFNNEFNNFLNKIKQSNKGIENSLSNQPFKPTKYDYQNVFHSIQDSMDITNKLTPHSKLPLILTSLCTKIKQLNGFETEGIFRKSAMATEIDRIKIQLSQNKYIIDTNDPHVAACLLKDWLRGLKDSLIPQTHYDIAIQMAKKNQINNQSLEVFLSQLPEVNRKTIKFLVSFLKDLINEKNIPKTRMNIENVAIVFAPTILKCPHTDVKQLLANSKHEKTFTIELMQQLQTN